MKTTGKAKPVKIHGGKGCKKKYLGMENGCK